ncbi:hypothetical protein C6P46_005974 [Rhodotorula mucilaginosa]|uniref:SAC domain-containing protein n=1 Tax=Rhodotorula mucilaginosa TaxID=5537 RepID=A0A9P7B9B3_RHOMI|nr:hypothetical protein C6P46_005974 [Rhodotorula mucilaginosa]TKA52964.1 hypothetical protein B0A53_04267 [Rhodotorula sp. CCFEE 5036]
MPPRLSDSPLALVHGSLRVFADDQGLVISPTNDRSHEAKSAVRLRWGTNAPEAVEWRGPADQDGLGVHCLGGVLAGFERSYLIAVIDSETAAELPEPRSKNHVKVSVAKTVIAIPLESQRLAGAVLRKHGERQRLRQSRLEAAGLRTKKDKDASASATDSETDDTASEPGEADSDDPHGPLPSSSSSVKRPFWQRGFSKRKSPASEGKDPSVPTSSEEVAPSAPGQLAEPTGADEAASGAGSSQDATALPELAATATESLAAAADKPAVSESQHELDVKLVAECLRVMTGLYFSHGTDITRSLQSKHDKADPLRHTPRWRSADRRFWLNENLMSPFVQAGLDSYVHILMQGFVDEVSVTLPIASYPALSSESDAPPTPSAVTLELTVVSRRSTERPGLRYQRRGINASGQVANFVETEFIVECKREGTPHVGSFVQTRGSIPIYWSQSPWALKPPPVLERTPEESRAAMKKHLDALRDRYGRLESSHSHTTLKRFGDYVSFDFHRETKGFNYSRISNLIDDIEPDLTEMRTFWSTPDEVFSTQAGVCRVNCIDSLDRTNVVQSAIARWVLNQHLIHLGITSAEEKGMHDDLDVAFNVLWADNGDAISREYAGTSALKGDFTRTGKRDWRGAMNDASNSIARILQSTVTDFFKQAALDYILGVNLNAFQEFAERLETSDPGEIVRIAAVRQEALDTAANEVLADGETKVAGWVLLSPSEINVVRPRKGGKYEEKVLLLSQKATYVVSYDYTLQKVSSYIRIPNSDVLGVQTGTYIISALDASGRDPVENFGLLLRYRASHTTERIRTYSLRTTSLKKKRVGLKDLTLPAQAPGQMPQPDEADRDAAETHFVAFKALRKDAVKVTGPDGTTTELPSKSRNSGGETAKDIVEDIAARVREECDKVGIADFVVEKDIISLVESKAATSIVDRLSHR